MELIDKSALVSEIERILNIAEEHWDTDYVEGARWFADKLQNSINTIQQNINIDITNIDKIIEENGVDPNSKEAKMFKESYCMALEKFKAQKGE